MRVILHLGNRFPPLSTHIILLSAHAYDTSQTNELRDIAPTNPTLVAFLKPTPQTAYRRREYIHGGVLDIHA